MDYEFDCNALPLAYLITIRCYGTWLHGDERGAVDRHGFNVYGTPRRAPNRNLETLMRQRMKQSPVLLSQQQRAVIEDAIDEVCKNRGYDLKAVNARTNHVHSVVSAQVEPDPIVNAFKSYATRKLREAGLIGEDTRPWARGKSARWLWKPRNVSRAIDYVLYGQGGIPYILADDVDDDE